MEHSTIPNLNCKLELIDRKKIDEYVTKRFQQDSTNIKNGKIFICISQSGTALTKYEMDIVRGIILVNGHDYYEI